MIGQARLRPPWRLIAGHFPVVREARTATPRATSNADHSQAWLRDRLDTLHIDVTDERDLYVVLAVIALAMEVADLSHETGQTSCDERRGVYALGMSVTAGLIDYVPRDVR